MRDEQEAQARGQRIGPVGDDHRRAGKRQFERHRAGRGKRGAGKLEGREFVVFAADDVRRHRPGASPCSISGRTLGDRRQDDLEGTGLGLEPAQGLAEGRHQSFDFARPAAGQHHEDGTVVGDAEPAAQSLGVKACDPVELLDQRMADIAASCGPPSRRAPPARTAGGRGCDRRSGASCAPGPAATPTRSARRSR